MTKRMKKKRRLNQLKLLSGLRLRRRPQTATKERWKVRKGERKVPGVTGKLPALKQINRPRNRQSQVSKVHRALTGTGLEEIEAPVVRGKAVEIEIAPEDQEVRGVADTAAVAVVGDRRSTGQEAGLEATTALGGRNGEDQEAGVEIEGGPLILDDQAEVVVKTDTDDVEAEIAVDVGVRGTVGAQAGDGAQIEVRVKIPCVPGKLMMERLLMIKQTKWKRRKPRRRKLTRDCSRRRSRRSKRPRISQSRILLRNGTL